MIEFRNEPLSNFHDPAVRDRIKEALAQVEGMLGQYYPLVLDGRRVDTASRITSVNPAQIDQVIGEVAAGDASHVDKAVEAGWKAFPEWARLPAEARAGYLFQAAAALRRRKFEFAAWMVYEVGKNWAEADADVAEAIDFLEYYGREAIRLGKGASLVPYPGEDNRMTYIPLGVGAIIAPWNFPVAILVGMSSAALVTGNPVIIKPSSQAPVVAAKWVELLEEIGVPAGVVQYLPGPGGAVGDALVDHPGVRFVNFTGSKEVGLRIVQRAATPAPGCRWIKRVVAEMGGKDGIIVDETADLAAAVQGILTSAFGFQGQKCSAGSRAIVVRSVYDEVVERLREGVKQWTVGKPADNAPMGPVIDESAYRKILHYMEIGREEGRLVAGGGPAEGPGFYLQPTIFAEVHPKARIAQEEIFGPVLAVIPAENFEEAVEIFNDTEYGLTGSLYTRRRDRVEYVREHMFCGNLYINRKCTGALVGVHPFGGFNMSGTDSKAGGPDYLLLFTQAKAVSEVL
ncbi:L-glutamate gamma-semialdehyde dehydrogenase [Kyrpidia spormannii]|uniref:1-pyrroline-5-carboxylate dehydrogenase n=1 Tax=Kyrpidia spormannii TaxID=2055160 RepID=A0ACA8Z644_9BACL|nr:L-glutamate gamma-semialdehyde dehydrogenase [Kyrpidia spormannii]CAB3389516.1 1-pyrroline-5-carboxylate dehydrogenase [Kyrpidia spormannii]